jgi:hypothetical protein
MLKCNSTVTNIGSYKNRRQAASGKHRTDERGAGGGVELDAYKSDTLLVRFTDRDKETQTALFQLEFNQSEIFSGT